MDNAPTPTPTRRLAAFRFTPDALIEFFKAHQNGARRFVIAEHGLPDDVQFVRAGHDPYGELVLVLESASFAEVPEGATMPDLDRPLVRVIFDDEVLNGG